MDIYRESLLILCHIFEEEKLDKWHDWMQKDIRRWDNQHSAQHHLKAYGGVGTLNDLRIGGATPERHWRGAVFEITKKVAWAYAAEHEGGAKANLLQIVSDFDGALEGWECVNCNHIAIRGIDVERNVANNLVGLIFSDLVVKNDLQSIFEFEFYEAVAEEHRVKLLADSNVGRSKVYAEVVSWFKRCPVCNSGNLQRVAIAD